MRCVIIVALAVLVVAALLAGLLVDRARADGPSPRFPYAELAALAGAVAPPVEVSFTLERDAAVRVRPALDWPVVARFTAGDDVAALGITPGGDPWLLVRLAGDKRGWLRLADTGYSGAPIARLAVMSPPVIEAAPVNGDHVWLRMWPNGLEAGWLSEEDRTLAVMGRSLDGEWIAVRFYGEVQWAPAAQFALLASDVSVADLPIFITRETTLAPVGPRADLQPALLPRATDWAWTAGGQVVGVGERAIWRYDPQSGALETHPRPPGDATIAPDGEHVAVAECVDAWYECGKPHEEPFDIVIVPTDGGEWMRVRDIHHTWRGWKFGTPYRIGEWSPGGRALLVPGASPHHGWPGFAVEYSVVDVESGHHRLPRPGEGQMQYWVWLADGRLLLHEPHIEGSALHVAAHEGDRLREIAQPPVIAEGLHRWFRTENGHPWASLKAAVRSRDGSWVLLDLESGAAATLEIAESTDEFSKPSRGRRFAFATTVGGDRVLLLFDGPTGAAAQLPLPDGVEEIGAGRHFAPAGERLLLNVKHEGEWRLYVVELGSGEWIEVNGQGDGSVCGGAVRWSPDGERFAIERLDLLERRGADWYRRDGLAAFDGEAESVQILIYSRTGAFVRAFRTLEHWPYSARRKVEWSPDGRWLGFGERTVGPFECPVSE